MQILGFGVVGGLGVGGDTIGGGGGGCGGPGTGLIYIYTHHIWLVIFHNLLLLVTYIQIYSVFFATAVGFLINPHDTPPTIDDF